MTLSWIVPKCKKTVSDAAKAHALGKARYKRGDDLTRNEDGERERTSSVMSDPRAYMN